MALQFVASQPVWRQRSTNEAAGNGFVLFHGKLCRSSVDRCPTSRLSLSPRDFFFFGYFFFYSLTDFPPYKYPPYFSRLLRSPLIVNNVQSPPVFPFFLPFFLSPYSLPHFLLCRFSCWPFFFSPDGCRSVWARVQRAWIGNYFLPSLFIPLLNT